MLKNNSLNRKDLNLVLPILEKKIYNLVANFKFYLFQIKTN